MDYRDSPDEAQFRARLRAWLADNAKDSRPPETNTGRGRANGIRRFTVQASSGCRGRRSSVGTTCRPYTT